jgi:hypothetical protein
MPPGRFLSARISMFKSLAKVRARANEFARRASRLKPAEQPKPPVVVADAVNEFEDALDEVFEAEPDEVFEDLDDDSEQSH